MAEAATVAIEALAQELGWQGNAPAGADAEALALLLDDEFERLDTVPRKTFAERLPSTCPEQLGSGILVCPKCQHCCLGRYQPDDGRCRACSAELNLWGETGDRDSGFGFVLSSYGAATDATVLNPADAGELSASFNVARDRKLKDALRLDDDNKSWDDLLDEIEERRARREAEKQAKLEAAKQAKLDAQRQAAAEAARIEAEAKAAAEAAQRAAEQKARAAAEAKARAEAEQKAREEATRAEREAAEAARLAELEKTRPALGCVLGQDAGKPVRIPDLPEGGASGDSAVYVVNWPDDPIARLHVGSTPATVDGTTMTEDLDLEMGALITIGEQAWVLEETQEMGSQVAGTVHFARADKMPGGPWPFWNEELKIGATHDCGINVVDDGVADVHAKVVTRFGVVVIEDLSGDEDGLFIDAERTNAAILFPNLEFRLGARGPLLKVGEGEAKQKAGEKARAMKPSRHKRTVFEIRNAKNQLVRKVFVFTRREVRFGSQPYSSTDDTRMINELTLVPSPKEQADVGEKQGGLALTRDGVELRRDGGDHMFFNDEELAVGKAVGLKRRFKVRIGPGIEIDGRVYRSPSAVERDRGPARLGMKGGHPYECVRLDRKRTPHTYVFLVRMLRIGSEPFAPLRLTLPEVAESHCQIMFSQGKFLIVAPKADAPVFLGDVEMDPGVAFPLEIDTVIKVGQASLLFRVVEDSDFEWG